MCRGVRVQDEWTFICGLWLQNRSIVLVLAAVQLVVAAVSFAQHVYSVASFNKVQECIANYLDGGYMRCLWCFGQMAALAMTVGVCLFMRNPHPLLLWPVLIMQNAYCFGLVILTIATADKLLVSILHPVNPQLNLLILYFGVGTCTNHMFDYILWHYYWHEERQFMARTGRNVIPFWV